MRKAFVFLALLNVAFVFGQQRSAKPSRSTAISELKPPPPTKLIKRVTPQYPPTVSASAALAGVVVHLTIDKEGVPKDLRIVKGDPILADAVVAALRQWRWKPYKLDGETVEIGSDVYVRFEARPN